MTYLFDVCDINEFGNLICGCGEELIIFMGNEPGDVQAICPICDCGE